MTQTIKNIDWWNTGWSFRKLITVDSSKVTANVNGFPMLVKGVDPDLALHAQSDGDDVCFVSFDNTTKLNHQIEKYVSASGELVSWVKVDLSSTTNTKFWMYYGNSLASNQQSPSDVWDSSFKAVWHLNEPSGNALDSTVNANIGAPAGVAYGATGQTDGAYQFDGVNDYVNVPDSTSLDLTSGATIELWVKLNTAFSATSQSNLGLLDKGVYQLFLAKSDGKLKFSLDSSALTSWGTSYDSPMPTIMTLGVYNGKLYAGSDSSGVIYAYDGTSWNIGYDSPATTIYALAVYNGKLYAGSDNSGIIYVYDGTSWSTAYDSAATAINALAVYNGKLYAGSDTGGIIYVYDGSSWSTAYDSAETAIRSLAVYDGKLYAGTNPNGLVYVYDGSSWSTSYDSAATWIRCLAVYNGKLYAGSDNSGIIYVYDGSSWSTAYDSLATNIRSLVVYNGRLYAGSDNSGIIYVYDGSSWSTAYDSAESAIYSLAVYNGRIYAGTFSGGIIYAYGNNVVLASTKASWDTNWHHIVVTYGASWMRIYVDGASDSSRSSSITIDTNNMAMLLAKTYGSQMAGGTPEATNGIIDEVRVSSTARSIYWVQTEYNNQNSPGTFYSVSGEQTKP